jgi:hypothetical protein
LPRTAHLLRRLDRDPNAEQVNRIASAPQPGLAISASATKQSMIPVMRRPP